MPAALLRFDQPRLLRLGGAGQRIEERLEQVGEGSALAGDDEGLRRRLGDARRGAPGRRAGQLGLGKADLRLVAGRLGALASNGPAGHGKGGGTRGERARDTWNHSAVVAPDGRG